MSHPQPGKKEKDMAVSRELAQAALTHRLAIEMDPDDVAAYVQLGTVLQAAGKLAEAEAWLQQAALLQPHQAEIYFRLGVIQAQANNYQAAARSFHQVNQLVPDNPEVYFNLGVVQAGEQRFLAAEESFRKAVELNPGFAKAHYNLGLVLKEEDKVAEAIPCFHQAIANQPDYFGAYNNLGLIYKKLGQFPQAEDCLRQALSIAPTYLPAFHNLAAVLKGVNRLAEAEDCLRQALQIDPQDAPTYNYLGVVLTEGNKLAAAENCFQKAIALAGTYIEAEFSLGILWLLQGNYLAGWEKFELRYPLFGHTQPDIRRWRGEDLTGCKILLFREQGFGDNLQFVRYAHQVAKLAAETVVWVRQPLAQLLTESPRAFRIHSGEDLHESFDFACPLLSLPLVFKTTLETIPQEGPYVQASGEKIGYWREKLNSRNPDNLLKVGVVWAGNEKHLYDHNRSIPLETMSRLFAIPQICWISAQVGPRCQMLPDKDYGVQDFSSQLVDFADTAGLFANLDLLITVDTAAAHLAGAMGINTWLLIPYAPDWRWLMQQEDSPWYPTLRLFRQQQLGDWPEVLDRVAAKLRCLVKEGKT